MTTFIVQTVCMHSIPSPRNRAKNNIKKDWWKISTSTFGHEGGSWSICFETNHGVASRQTDCSSQHSAPKYDMEPHQWASKSRETEDEWTERWEICYVSTSSKKLENSSILSAHKWFIFHFSDIFFWSNNHGYIALHSCRGYTNCTG